MIRPPACISGLACISGPAFISGFMVGIDKIQHVKGMSAMAHGQSSTL